MNLEKIPIISTYYKHYVILKSTYDIIFFDIHMVLYIATLFVSGLLIVILGLQFKLNIDIVKNLPLIAFISGHIIAFIAYSISVNAEYKMLIKKDEE